jgi:Uncharacterised protein family (UPF0164)
MDAQIVGGRQTFQFLNLPNSARISGLGGNQLAVQDDDAAFAWANPATLNPSMSGKMTFNHHFHLADLQNGYFGYAQNLKKWGIVGHFGVQYMNYGKVKMADEYGLVTGEFSPKETAFVIGAGYKLYEKVTLGANLKFAQSNLILGQSSAILGDFAALYADTSKKMTATLVFKNIGGQVNFYENTREPMPFDIQIGLSKRLKHLPFRIGIVAHHLYQRDVRYDDPALRPNADDFFGGQQKDSRTKQFFDNTFSHLIFNGEFLLGKQDNFQIRVGYNHLRHRELTVPNLRSLAGFSAGIGLKISRFRVDFGYSVWHLAGGTPHLGVSTNLGEFF